MGWTHEVGQAPGESMGRLRQGALFFACVGIAAVAYALVTQVVPLPRILPPYFPLLAIPVSPRWFGRKVSNLR